MTLLELQQIAHKGYAKGESFGHYFNEATGEANPSFTSGDILEWFLAVEIEEGFDPDLDDQMQLADAVTTLERALLDIQGAIGTLRQKQVHCRYCEHLKDINTGGRYMEYVGMCEFQEHPMTCGRFQLASYLNTKK